MTLEDLGVEQVEEIQSPQPARDLNIVQVTREDARGRVATIFVVGFFFVLLAGIIVAALDGTDRVGSVTSIMLAISGILSGPLGFVIGYYFRSQENQ